MKIQIINQRLYAYLKHDKYCHAHPGGCACQIDLPRREHQISGSLEFTPGTLFVSSTESPGKGLVRMFQGTFT